MSFSNSCVLQQIHCWGVGTTAPQTNLFLSSDVLPHQVFKRQHYTQLSLNTPINLTHYVSVHLAESFFPCCACGMFRTKSKKVIDDKEGDSCSSGSSELTWELLRLFFCNFKTLFILGWDYWYWSCLSESSASIINSSLSAKYKPMIMKE